MVAFTSVSGTRKWRFNCYVMVGGQGWKGDGQAQPDPGGRHLHGDRVDLVGGVGEGGREAVGEQPCRGFQGR